MQTPHQQLSFRKLDNQAPKVDSGGRLGGTNKWYRYPTRTPLNLLWVTTVVVLGHVRSRCPQLSQPSSNVANSGRTRICGNPRLNTSTKRVAALSNFGDGQTPNCHDHSPPKGNVATNSESDTTGDVKCIMVVNDDISVKPIDVRSVSTDTNDDGVLNCTHIIFIIVY